MPSCGPSRSTIVLLYYMLTENRRVCHIQTSHLRPSQSNARFISPRAIYVQPYSLCTLYLYFSCPYSCTVNLILIQLIVAFLKPLKCHCSVRSQLRPAKWSNRSGEKAWGPFSPGLFPFLQLRSLSLLDLVFQLCCPAVLLVLNGLCDCVPEA